MAFICHSCSANTPNGQKRVGPCKICYSKEVNLCPTCAFWEFGPPAPALQNELRPRTRKREGTIIKTCPDPPVVRDAHAANLVTDVRNMCATVDAQWANHGFDADNHAGPYDRSGGYVFAGGHAAEANQAPGFHCHDSNAADGTYDGTAQAMLDDFDNLYARQEPGGMAGNQAKADDDLERVMLMVMASAHERAGYINDRWVHRWDAPTIAAHHFTQCFAGYGAIAAAANLALAPTVLGSTIIEDMVFGKLSVAYAYWRVVEEVAAPGDRADFVRLSALLLHLWLKNAPVGAIPGGHNFQPSGAPGIVTPELRAATLGGNGRAFRGAVEKKLAALYACFNGPAPHIPAHDRRFHDGAVHGHGALTARQKRFLQSLPRMDTPVHGGVATACEEAVRARIRKMLKRIRDGVAGPGTGPVSQALLAANNDPARDAVIDTIVQTLHKGLNWVETSSSDRPYVIYDGLGAGPRAAFEFLAFAMTSAVNVAWSHVFPDCMPAAVATFPGQSALPDMLDPAYVNDGRQNARRWYPHWRWDKDHRVYAGLGLPGVERGKVAQFTFHPGAPFPNRHYGEHCVVWDSAILGRAVLLVGDKGRPNRSMTILLHDLLTCPPDVLGDPTAGKPNTVRALLESVDANSVVNVPAFVAANPANAQVTGPAAPLAPAATARTVLLDRVRGVIARHAVGDYTNGNDTGQRLIVETYPSVAVDPIVECHIFGPTTLHNEAYLVIVQEARLELGLVHPAPLANAPHAWVASLHGMAHPPFNTARYRGQPAGAGRPLWQAQRADPLPGGGLGGIISKVPEHS